MVIPALEDSVRRLFNKGLAASTQKAYGSAVNRYLAFCKLFNISKPFPLSEQVLCYFVSHLSAQGLRHQTIKSYVSGIRHAQIALGLPDPFAKPLFPKFEYVMKGIKRTQAERGVGRRPHLPITPVILRKIFEVWDKAPSPDTPMLKAACCLGFFGFLRTTEFTVPSWQKFDQGAHLALADIAVDNHSKPSVLQVHIKQSKTDPFRKGVHIFIGRSLSDICPVNMMVKYLAARGPSQGPLFLCATQAPLSRPRLVKELRSALAQAGIDPAAYCGHSFRIGAATTAAASGVEDSLIQILGRWQSTAYLQYVKVPRSQLAAISRSLMNPRH